MINDPGYDKLIFRELDSLHLQKGVEDWMIQRLINLRSEWKYEWFIEWMNQSKHQWLSELIIEWMSERESEGFVWCPCFAAKKTYME